MGEIVAGLTLGWLLLLSGYDIRQRRLPNWLTLPAAVVVPAVAIGAGHGRAAVAGAVGLTALYLVVHLIAPAGMGAGDVKLALGLGALTGSFGADVWLLAAGAAPLLTGAIGLFFAATGDRRRSVPHGPSMCLASAVAAAMGLCGGG